MGNENTNRLRELGRVARTVKADSSSDIVIKELDFNDEEEVTKTALQVDYMKAPELYPPRQGRDSTIETASHAVVAVLTVLPPWGRVVGLSLILGAGTFLAVRIWG